MATFIDGDGFSHSLNTAQMDELKLKLRAAGYDFACYETDYIPGLKLECICDKNGREIDGDFILNIDSMGHGHGLLEAGFGFGIREHRHDDVLGYLTADDAFDLIEGTFWDKQGIKERA